METKFKTREEWLIAAVAIMTPHFDKQGYKVPPVRVSCGFASSKKALGSCWAAEAAADGICQIFVSPVEDLPTVAQGILATLVHEVVHAVVGFEAKHGPDFKACATAVGLEGKMTATVASDELITTLESWVAELGPYPHVKLNLSLNPVKKQTTRMIKCTCRNEDCEFLVRLSRKCIDDVGMPHCPKHGKMESDYIPPTEADDSGETDEPIED